MSVIKKFYRHASCRMKAASTTFIVSSILLPDCPIAQFLFKFAVRGIMQNGLSNLGDDEVGFLREENLELRLC